MGIQYPTVLFRKTSCFDKNINFVQQQIKITTLIFKQQSGLTTDSVESNGAFLKDSLQFLFYNCKLLKKHFVTTSAMKF